MKPSSTPFVAFALLALTACSHPSTAATQTMTPVTIVAATAPEVRAAFRGPGSIVAAHTYRVGFEIAGRINTVRHDVGDRVAPGETLATIDAADYAAQFRAETARAAAARANAAKAANGSRGAERVAALETVGAAQAQLDRARAAGRLAVANRIRSDQLYAEGDVAAQQHDAAVAADADAQAQVSAARAVLAQARAQRSLVDDGSRREDLAAADAEAVAAEAGAELAAVTLRKTVLASPADAYVLTRAIDPGSQAQPGSVAFTLTDARDPDVLVAVPESKLPRVVIGTSASIVAGGLRRTGVVIRIEPAADVVTRTANVRVRVPDLRARPGTVVDVSVGSERLPGDAGVPLAAILTATDGSQQVAVYDPAHRTTARRAVRVLATDAGRALVTGIAPGTQVVGAGAHLVRPGDVVRIVSGS